MNQNAQIIGDVISHNTFDGTNYTLNCAGSRWAISAFGAPLVATSNVYEGGIGVVMARAAIGNDRYNDEAMCPDVRDDREQVAEVTLQGELAPNPANEISYIKLANVVSGQLFVYNAQGQLVQNQTLDNTDIITVSTATLPMGIYQVQVKASSGVQFLGKLSIAH